MKKNCALLVIGLLAALAGWAGGPDQKYSVLNGLEPIVTRSAVPDSPQEAVGGLQFTGITTYSATLEWASSSGATDYLYEINESDLFEPENSVTSGTTTGTSVSIASQPAGNTLFARVFAIGPKGISSARTASCSLIDRCYGYASNLFIEFGNPAANYVFDGASATWFATSRTTNATQTTAAKCPELVGSGVWFLGASETVLSFRTMLPEARLSSASVVGIMQATTASNAGTIIDTVGGWRTMNIQMYFDGIWRLYTYYNATSDYFRHHVSSWLYKITKFSSSFDGTKSGSDRYTVVIDGTKVTPTYSTGTATQTGVIYSDKFIGRAPGGTPEFATVIVYTIRQFDAALPWQALASATNGTWLGVPPRGPTLAQTSDIGANYFVASWSQIPGASGYRLDVSANASFTPFISGYKNKILPIASAAGTVISVPSAGTYYVRLRSESPQGIGPSGAAAVISVP